MRGEKGQAMPNTDTDTLLHVLVWSSETQKYMYNNLCEHTFPVFRGRAKAGSRFAIGLPASDMDTTATDSPGFFLLIVAGVNGSLENKQERNREYRSLSHTPVRTVKCSRKWEIWHFV